MVCGDGRLPLRAAPVVGETILGFLVRLAERNGLHLGLPFARSLGIPFATLTMAATGEFDLAQLAIASQIPLSTLLAMTYRGEQGRPLSFRGRPVSRRALIFARRSFCPACLAEKPYHRDMWDLALSTACLRHRTLLSNECHACGKTTGWRDSSIRTCRCGFDLSRSPMQAIPDGALAAISEVHVLFGTDDVLDDPRSTPWPKVLRSLGAEEASSLMFHLGWYASSRSGIPRSLADPAFLDAVPSILTLGYQIGLDWPEAFHAFLSRCAALTPAEGRYGARRAFGPILGWMTSLDKGSPLSPLLWRELERFMASRPELRTKCPRLAPAPEAGSFLTLTQASRTLHRSVERVGPVLKRHGFFVESDGNGKGAPILLRKSDVERLAAELVGLEGKKAVQRRLSCSFETLERILKTGVLPPVDGVVAELSGKPRWRASDVQAFLKAFEEVPPQRDTMDPSPAAILLGRMAAPPA
ncbi:TniQ family protein [Lichenicoccus roseus]|uniref:TniQ family protein n=1 Tax=Lichenicoccus roseus TaxID=2683649 RepID=A0A5R9J4I2_9PROT|nr:TniQ family protein [Lichenicoccus roseus]TLU71889.1 TniQ family protein [Lichenicoccus roseus]